MNGEAWKRGYTDGRKFSATRSGDDGFQSFLQQQGGGAMNSGGAGSRLVGGVLSFTAIIGIYAAMVFFIGYALGADLSFRSAFIIAACGATIRHIDAAVMRSTHNG